ncbi:MAG TPA: DedA family protein [Vicinamibacterales bacterium]|jgi:membrane protein DedA with SNARE-associated domain
MTQTALAWLSQYGGVALFLLLFAGIFGLPVPDETLLVASGALIAKGTLEPLPTLLAAMLGSSAGITLSFIVGRAIGPPALRMAGRLFHVPETALIRVRRWFAHLGKWTLTFGYFVPGVRHLTAIVAGASALGYATFAAFAYAGAALWSATFLAIGYGIGDRWPLIFAAVRRHAAVAVAILLVVLTATGVAWWRSRRPHDSTAS